MGRYLALWDMDRTKIPMDIKERAVGFSMLIEIVKEDMKKGATKEWGVFPGEFAGYCVIEATEVDAMILVQKYTPYVYFKVSPVASVKDVDEMIKVMNK